MQDTNSFSLSTSISPFIVVYVTTRSQEDAENLADILLKEKLASCINILPGITSMYRWKEKLEKEIECLMMIKTKGYLFKKLEKTVKENHPYDVPEIISVPIQQGSKDYLDWITESVESEEKKK